METQKTVNQLNNSVNELSQLTTKNWYVIHNQNGEDYGVGNENGVSIKFETKNIKSSLYHYSEAYILILHLKTMFLSQNV